MLLLLIIQNLECRLSVLTTTDVVVSSRRQTWLRSDLRDLDVDTVDVMDAVTGRWEWEWA
jgi:hypothetical protein